MPEMHTQVKPFAGQVVEGVNPGGCQRQIPRAQVVTILADVQGALVTVMMQRDGFLGTARVPTIFLGDGELPGGTISGRWRTDQDR